MTLHSTARDTAVPGRVVLMSIKPMYWEKILAGSKRFELRRRPPRVGAETLVLVYASAPTKALVGAFRVRAIHSAGVEAIWRKFGPHLGVDRGHYRDYFTGVAAAWAIEVSDPMAGSQISLTDLRARFPGFRPPQSFMYWGPAQVGALDGQWTLARH